MHGRCPTIASVHGIVAAAHPLAAGAGASVLRAGGNAFDAAVATAAALNVCEPYMSGLGGMGVAICYFAATDRVLCLDFCPPVPQRFNIARIATREDARRGAFGVGLPSCLAGWYTLNRDYGTVEFATLLEPAIRLASDGVPAIELNVEALADSSLDLGRFPALYPEWATIFAPRDKLPRLGDLIRQPALAATFKQIAKDGVGYLYDGELGERICSHVSALGGWLTMSDFQNTMATWQLPLAIDFAGSTVFAPPLPSHGFQFLLTLKVLERIDRGKAVRNDPSSLDAMIRAIRVAASQRIELGNPSDEELSTLLADDSIDTLAHTAHDPTTLLARTEFPSRDSVKPPVSENTTSFSIGDKHGNLVCITQSLGQYFGSGIVVPGTGVCLNDLLQYDNLDPGSPACIRGGGPLSLPFAPSFIKTAGKSRHVTLGTPGSFGISQTQAQVLNAYLRQGQGLREAIEAPRLRVWDDARVELEDRIPFDTVRDLQSRGHAATAISGWSKVVGGMQAIEHHPDTGVLFATADFRRDGYVATA